VSEAKESTRVSYGFGEYLLDTGARTLTHASEPVTITAKVFDALVLLVARAGEAVEKEEFFRHVWRETAVEDSSLTQAIFVLRKLLKDGEQRMIVTLPGRGYMFTPRVETIDHVPRGNSSPVEVASRAAHRPLRIILIVGAATVLTMVLLLFVSRTREPAQSKGIRSVVVLPFNNLSGHTDQEYMADGMTDELITALAKISSLRVISRTSAMHYKGARASLPEIARELGVDAVIVGAVVVRAGNRVRIQVQLIEARTDSHLWAETYDRQLEDMLALQTQVARTIAGHVQVKLTGPEQMYLSRDTAVNGAAYEAYLKGRFFWNQRSEMGISRAIGYFQQSIADAPAEAMAYAGLADAWVMSGIFGFRPGSEAFPQARLAALKAIELDGSLGEAHTALAEVLKDYDWDWNGAEAEYRRALELSPNYATLHQWYAQFLFAMQRYDEAVAHILRARDLDPLSIPINAYVGNVFYHSRRFNEGVAHCRKALELDPNQPLTHWFLSRNLVALKRIPEAITEAHRASELSNRSAMYLSTEAYMHARAGNRHLANTLLEEVEVVARQSYVSPFDFAVIYIGLGDRAKAFEWLERAYRERVMKIIELEQPIFDELRSDPQFHDLARRVGLPESISVLRDRPRVSPAPARAIGVVH
jgi:TolB-like protein/DNA-binding winged helix-turn-helix (wHTH) protein/Tfp pilus assembly protein PilF